jgi:hypothetical protein
MVELLDHIKWTRNVAEGIGLGLIFREEKKEITNNFSVGT